MHARWWLLPLMVAGGAACRIAQYLSRRSYWEDEALIVYNLKVKTAAQLMGPLTAAGPSQVAPPLWLLSERAMVVLFGTHEYATRALPLLMGMAALLAFAVLARSVLGRGGAAAAVAVFAFSDEIILKTTEVKPYISDALLAVLLLLATIPRAGSTRSPLQRLMLAAGITAVGFWVSYPLLFVFAGVSLGLLPAIAAPAEGRFRRLAGYVLANALVLASLIAVWVVTIRDQHSNALDAYWADEFFDWSRPWQLPGWFGQRLLRLGTYAADLGGAPLAVLAIAGAVYLWRRGDRRRFLILMGPFVIAVLVDWAGRFPFDGRRLSTYLLPGFILLGGFGIDGMLRWAGESRRRWAMLVAGVVVAPSVILAAIALVQPRTRAHARPAIEHVLDHRQPGDDVYTTTYAAHCYWPRGEPVPQTLTGRIAPDGRYWVILSHRPGRAAKILQRRLYHARAKGTQVGESFITPGGGGAAYLFRARSRNAP